MPSIIPACVGRSSRRTKHCTGNSYNAWGNAQAGYYRDAETGLYLCTWRYYDPQAGRWVTEDPIGYAGGLDVYGYCGGDPFGALDPSGLVKWVREELPEVQLRFAYKHAFLHFDSGKVVLPQSNGWGSTDTVGFGGDHDPANKQYGITDNTGYLDSNNIMVVEWEYSDPKYERILRANVERSAAGRVDFKVYDGGGGFYVCGSWIRDMVYQSLIDYRSELWCERMVAEGYRKVLSGNTAANALLDQWLARINRNRTFAQHPTA